MAVGITLSDEFKLPKEWLTRKGVFDPTLDMDAPLFIDPFLLAYSRQPEFKDCAFAAYEEHFGAIFSLLRMSEKPDDKAWKAALEKFLTGEVQGMSGTCLGYSKRSTHGHAFGPKKARQALIWAKEVIDLGVKDPEFFSVLSLFEGGVGPDLISDMVATITLDCILAFNARILREAAEELELKLRLQETDIKGRKALLLPNRHDNRGGAVILLADDILKHLPLLEDPRKLADAAMHNADLRKRVNAHISEVFKIRFKKEKERIKKDAMVSPGAFQALLDLMKLTERQPYDLAADPEGLMQWRPLADQFSGLFKLQIAEDPKLAPVERIDDVVTKIIEQFTSLIENNRMNRVFFVGDKPRHERFSQLLFFAIAKSYCDANGLDVSPESHAGAGPVDFKLSSGPTNVLVEIKLSTNGQAVKGYRTQLDAYMKAEGSARGHYVLINVGRLGHKWEHLLEITAKNPEFAKTHKLHFIDGRLKESASKRIAEEDDDEE